VAYYKEIQLAWTAFNSLTFHHVYRERNVEADGLSKVGLLLEASVWIMQEKVEGQSTEHLHSFPKKSYNHGVVIYEHLYVIF
jgi:hypothetical protein